MNKHQKRSLYESIMRDIAVQVKRRLNEDEFKTPKRNAKEKFMQIIGKDTGYQERIKKEQDKFFEDKRKPFLMELSRAESYYDLLMISKNMNKEGYVFPIAGMIDRNITPNAAVLSDVRWMSYDREGTFTADELTSCERKEPSNDTYVYTYYYSWRWWCSNILRVLFFPNEPWGSTADSKISDIMKKFAPKCPIVGLYREYFK